MFRKKYIIGKFLLVMLNFFIFSYQILTFMPGFTPGIMHIRSACFGSWKQKSYISFLLIYIHQQRKTQLQQNLQQFSLSGIVLFLIKNNNRNVYFFKSARLTCSCLDQVFTFIRKKKYTESTTFNLLIFTEHSLLCSILVVSINSSILCLGL